MTYLLPRPLPGSAGGTRGLPKASVPSLLRQSGQYHFARRAGICVMPTHSKWNHSLSHWGGQYMAGRREAELRVSVYEGVVRRTLLSQEIIWP